MASPEARRLAAELLSHYPSLYVTESHIRAIADGLERAGMDIADDVCSLLRLRCKSAPNGADIAETAREVRKETMSPRMDIGYDRPVKRWLTEDEIRHGVYHLRRFFDGHTEDRESMHAPWACECDGWRTPDPHPATCSCHKRRWRNRRQEVDL